MKKTLYNYLCVIFIFAKIVGCGQKNIREIKILFDNSLIVSGVPETIKELLNDMTNFTIKWLTVIFNRLSGLISRIPCLVFFRFRRRNYEPKYCCTLCCVTAHTYCKIPSLTGYRTTLAIHSVSFISNIYKQQYIQPVEIFGRK